LSPAGPSPKIAVVGAGASGLSAAWHAARRGRDVIVVDPHGAGGELMNAGVIDSVPGLPPGVRGPDLVARMVQQLDEHQIEWLQERAVSIGRRSRRFRIVTDAGSDLAVDAVVVATGASHRRLGIPGEAEFEHRGVSHCAVCDGPLYRDRPVAVVGGGDAAADAAAFLAGICSRVYVLHRGAQLEAVDILRRRLDGLANVERWPETEVRRIHGIGAVDTIEVEDAGARPAIIGVAGVFVTVGMDPDAALVAGLASMDAAGCVVVDPAMMSSVPGLFAVGAVRAGSSGQLAGSVGDGVAAAVAADHWLQTEITSATTAGINRSSKSSGRVYERREYFDYADFFDSMDESGIGDGLPLVPPSRERVDRFAAVLHTSPDDLMQPLPDGRRLRYADLIMSAIMAGCRPEYMPVVVAAAESLLTNLGDRQPRLMDSVSVVLVNGPIRDAIDLNCSDGLFGPGWRANATIGRAIHLFLHGYVDGRPPTGFGDAGQIAFCFGEDERTSPWTPLHVQRGFQPAQSTATVFSANVYRHLLDRQNTDADGILEYLRLFLRGRASGTRLFGDVPLSLMIVIGRELRRQIAPRYSKQELFERLSTLLTVDDGTPFGPINVQSPDDLLIVGAGGVATPALWCFITTSGPPPTVQVRDEGLAVRTEPSIRLREMSQGEPR
jgi:thioredoxin reductase (NADPH)